jgi:hypothetical protein
MSRRFDDSQIPAPEEHIYAEGKVHFADYLKRFTAYREAVERLERNLSIMAVEASIAASSSSSQDTFFQTDDGLKWHRDVALMKHIHLCHRSLADETEYAAVEYFPSHNRHEIWNRARDAVDVVRTFALEQRNALQIWKEDLKAQVRGFLTGKYLGQDLGQKPEIFASRLTHSISVQPS